MNNPASGSLPASRAQALEELRQKIHSPEGEKEDVEALLGALRQPMEPGQDVRELAEVLNRILEDPLLGALRGREGEWVDGAAAQALVALGEPHASTLSERAVAALERARPSNREPAAEETRGGELSAPAVGRDGAQERQGEPAKELSWRVPVAVCFLVLAGCEILFTLSAERGDVKAREIALLFTGTTLVAPALVLMRTIHRLVYGVTATLMVLVSAGLSVFLLFSLYELYAPAWSLFEIGASRVALVLALFFACVIPQEKQ